MHRFAASKWRTGTPPRIPHLNVNPYKVNDLVDVNPRFIIQNGWRPAKIIQLQHNEIQCVYQCKNKMVQSWFNVRDTDEVQAHKQMSYFYFNKDDDINEDNHNDNDKEDDINEDKDNNDNDKEDDINDNNDNDKNDNNKEDNKKNVLLQCNLCCFQCDAKAHGIVMKHIMETHKSILKKTINKKKPITTLYRYV